MTCEALVIGSIAGLALTAAAISFQVITDRKAATIRTQKPKEARITADASNTIGA